MTRPMHHPRPWPAARRRRVPTWTVVLVAAALALALGGALLVTLAEPASARVVREPVQTAGSNPFMPAVGDDAAGVVAPAGAGGRFSGDTAGLYGGTRSDATCDDAMLTGYLRDDPAKASAWAGALGLQVSQIDSYVSGLTPVVLRADTLVTNHGYAGGTATAFASVLQAGTAVFVDRWGTPVVRCACGNPLAAAPTLYPGIVYTGPTWVSFSETEVSVVVSSSVEIHAYTLVDPWEHRPFSRPATSHGDRDGDAPAAGDTAHGQSTVTGEPGTAAPGTDGPDAEAGDTGASGTGGSDTGGADTGSSDTGSVGSATPGTGDTPAAPFAPESGSYTVPCGAATLTGGRGSTSGGSPVELLSTSTADVDGDGRDETAVLLECGTGDAVQQSVQLLDDTGTLRTELPVPAPPTGSTSTPEFAPSSFTLGTGTLTTGMRVFEGTDTGGTGPTGSQTWTWDWTGGTFTLDGSTVQAVEIPETAPAPGTAPATETAPPTTPSFTPGDTGTTPDTATGSATTGDTSTPSSSTGSAGN